MKTAVLDTGKLADWIKAMSADSAVYGPVRRDQRVVCARLSGSDVPLLDYSNVDLPIKALFLPQSETLYTYQEDGSTAASLSEETFVLVGARSCDVRGLLCLDEVYEKSEPRDPYYHQRRENGTIVGLACRQPCGTCFCTSVGGGPAESAGMDVMAYELGETLLLEAQTPKGEALLEKCADVLDSADDSHTTARDKQVAKACDAMTPVPMDGVTEKLTAGFEAKLWERDYQRCLGCGTCTFYCPSCQCFDVFDEACAGGRQRVRCWDACMMLPYSKEASGHNPRRTFGQRMRQRVMHKFRYTVENYGRFSCVGCGRCVAKCPVNIDIRETISEVMK